jgi:hypothetical protein
MVVSAPHATGDPAAATAEFALQQVIVYRRAVILILQVPQAAQTLAMSSRTRVVTEPSRLLFARMGD